MNGEYVLGKIEADELVGATLGDIRPSEQGEHWPHVDDKGEKHGKVALPPLARSAFGDLHSDELQRARQMSQTFTAWK
ncbi:hypothetical protein [Pandoraea horticolens]|uniref:hypothetical protein n=1 Tax=Pandoraea horticolens TaxID=2508298 RepID=UPI001241909F|nr:hypothetical protein [Pandoraea horticolens]